MKSFHLRLLTALSPTPPSKVTTVFNSEHPNPISSSCLLSSTNPKSTPPI
ncbi:hypothetical protein N665_0022s0005 [Sinapis alba]|nr:hypothetical protein N665_0022s0005 [Sinapis alba]